MAQRKKLVIISSDAKFLFPDYYANYHAGERFVCVCAKIVAPASLHKLRNPKAPAGRVLLTHGGRFLFDNNLEE